MTRHTVLMATLLAAVSTAGAQTAEETFNSIFGGDLKKVAATSDPMDDVELGQVVLRSARQTKEANDLLAVLCEQAAALLAKHPSGLGAAVEALELEAAKLPAKRAACLDRILAIRQKQYQNLSGSKRAEAGEDLLAAGIAVMEMKASEENFDDALKLGRTLLGAVSTLDNDQRADLMARVHALSEAQKLAQSIQQLKDRLKAEPDDQAARMRLIRIYLADMDKPADAAKFVTADCDEALRTYLPLASQEPASLAETALMELGDWYRGQADEASGSAKANLLRRSATYYQAFLAKHAAEDLARSKATLTLDKVQKELEKFRGNDPGQWVDVLRHADVARPYDGQWRRQGRQVGFEGNRGHLPIPSLPNGNYEISVVFARRAENRWDRGNVVIHLPAAGGRAAFILAGNVEQPSGLLGLRTGPVRAPNFSMENNRQYTFAAKVTAARDAVEIVASVNGRKFVEWKGAPADVPKHSEFGQRLPQAIVVGAARSEVVFDSVRVRMLSGTLDKLTDAPADGRPGADGEKHREGEKPKEADRPREPDRPREGDRPREKPRG